MILLKKCLYKADYINTQNIKQNNRYLQGVKELREFVVSYWEGKYWYIFLTYHIYRFLTSWDFQRLINNDIIRFMWAQYLKEIFSGIKTNYNVIITRVAFSQKKRTLINSNRLIVRLKHGVIRWYSGQGMFTATSRWNIYISTWCGSYYAHRS